MVSRFISKVNHDLDSKTPSHMTKGQAMLRGRNAALKDAETIRKMRKAKRDLKNNCERLWVYKY